MWLLNVDKVALEKTSKMKNNLRIQTIQIDVKGGN